MMKDKYEVRFFRVGENSKGGDAIVIRLFDDEDNQHIIVVDGGYSKNGEQIVRFLVDECHTNTIDIMINTHPDIDHISGLITILDSDEVSVKKVIMNRPWKDANLNCSYFRDGRITDNSLDRRIAENFKKAKELEEKAEVDGVELVHPVAGNSYFDSLTILGPTMQHYREFLLKSDKTPDAGNAFSTFQRKVAKVVQYIKGNFIEWFDDEQTSPINETSIVSVLEIGQQKMLFTGDVGKVGLEAALDKLEEIEGNTAFCFTKVQLPHHGSRKNINPSILKRIGAADFYISCPPNGLEDGHPSRRLINKIYQLFPRARVFITSGSWLSFYHNVKIKGVPAQCQDVYDEMDGKVE